MATAVIIDGTVRVTFTSAVATVSAPTLTEINNGTPLETYITPDGLDIGMSTGEVDVSTLASTFTTKRAGRKVPAISVTFQHNTPTDTPYVLLTYRTTGYLIVRRGVAVATAFNSGDKVEVYPVECGEPIQVKPAPDSTWDFTVPMYVMSDPNTHAVVA